MKCPAAPRFRELVNMTPSEIRAWSKDPRSREYSLPETRNADRRTAAEIKDSAWRAWVAARNARVRERCPRAKVYGSD